MTQRGTTNTNCRGSAADRRRRKLWVLAKFGDGESAVCAFDGCTARLTLETMTVDRHPVMGIDGGTYARGNIRPACAAHNSQHGGEESGRRRAQRRAERLAALDAP